MSRYATAARALLRDTLLDAATELLAERRWGQVTMADIARVAGVSRQTVYNELGSREEFAQAYLLREEERLIAIVGETIARHAGDPPRALAEAFAAFLELAAEHPVIRAIAAGDGSEGLLALLTTQGRPVLELATAQLGALLREHWPGLRAGDARALSECCVRLAISHAALPSASPRETGAELARILGPHLEELVGSL
jgi:AcrR family transcriptional regulator